MSLVNMLVKEARNATVLGEMIFYAKHESRTITKCSTFQLLIAHAIRHIQFGTHDNITWYQNYRQPPLALVNRVYTRLTSARSCNYGCTSSWWWVSTLETCRAVYRNTINWIQSHIVGQLLNFIHDARTHEYKKIHTLPPNSGPYMKSSGRHSYLRQNINEGLHIAWLRTTKWDMWCSWEPQPI